MFVIALFLLCKNTKALQLHTKKNTLRCSLKRILYSLGNNKINDNFKMLPVIHMDSALLTFPVLYKISRLKQLKKGSVHLAFLS